MYKIYKSEKLINVRHFLFTHQPLDIYMWFIMYTYYLVLCPEPIQKMAEITCKNMDFKWISD